MLDGVPARGPGGWLDLARFQGDLRKIVGFAESGDKTGNPSFDDKPIDMAGSAAPTRGGNY